MQFQETWGIPGNKINFFVAKKDQPLSELSVVHNKDKNFNLVDQGGIMQQVFA